MAAIDTVPRAVAPAPGPAAQPPRRGQQPRPSVQLAAAARRAGWIAAVGLVALAGPLFGWTLGRARQVPSGSAALPPADVRLLKQNKELALRIQRDEQAMADLSLRLARLGPAGNGSLPVPGGSVAAATAPQIHAVTKAS